MIARIALALGAIFSFGLIALVALHAPHCTSHDMLAIAKSFKLFGC